MLPRGAGRDCPERDDKSEVMRAGVSGEFRRFGSFLPLAL